MDIVREVLIMKRKNNALRTAAVLFILLMVTTCLVSGIISEQAGIPHTLLPAYMGCIFNIPACVPLV